MREKQEDYTAKIYSGSGTSRQVWHPDGPVSTLSRAAVARLVHTFYQRVQDHPDLGPVFAKQIAGDWQPHLDKMVDFWCTMLLQEQSYTGRPLPVHMALPDLQDVHFDQWLALFYSTTREVFSPDLAAQFNLRAQRMADSFRLAVAVQRGKRHFNGAGKDCLVLRDGVINPGAGLGVGSQFIPRLVFSPWRLFWNRCVIRDAAIFLCLLTA